MFFERWTGGKGGGVFSLRRVDMRGKAHVAQEIFEHFVVCAAVCWRAHSFAVGTVIILRDGRVVAVGDHQDLMADDDYREMVQR